MREEEPGEFYRLRDLLREHPYAPEELAEIVIP